MTTTRKPTLRETLAIHRGRAIVVELQPAHMTLRQKGTRTRYELSYAQAFDLACKLLANQRRAEKKAGRRKSA